MSVTRRTLAGAIFNSPTSRPAYARRARVSPLRDDVVQLPELLKVLGEALGVAPPRRKEAKVGDLEGQRDDRRDEAAGGQQRREEDGQDWKPDTEPNQAT